jgi:hypothetical protein
MTLHHFPFGVALLIAIRMNIAMRPVSIMFAPTAESPDIMVPMPIRIDAVAVMIVFDLIMRYLLDDKVSAKKIILYRKT